VVGSFNVAANLVDCFLIAYGHRLWRWSYYPIGELVTDRVRGDGGQALYKPFHPNGVPARNPTVYTTAYGCALRPVVFYKPC